ncbi:MAG: CBS domain-containing protein [Coriobacteriia bacterium]|nr:CBS domain-containing protein [Coriobacteriia bacterium]MCL2536809.1 CBS domain-containing protein [Coriobacteriia bacterium]
MLYLSEFLHLPVVDAKGNKVGEVSDLIVNAKDIFPRVVALSFKTGDDTARILDWKDNVADFKLGDADDEPGVGILLKRNLDALEFTHLQDDELLLGRDLLHKQIVDVKDKKVARVSDLKLSADGSALRLLGAECGLTGRLHFMGPFKAGLTRAWMGLTGHQIKEALIAWNYIDIPGRDMSRLEMSISHKRLAQLRPADIADIIEQLDPETRRAVFAHLDKKDAADTVSELEDIYQTDVIGDLPEDHASSLLSEMEPDDATDILSGLEYEKAEKILQLMGIEDAEVIRKLMGYRNNSAGGIMTPEVAVATEDMIVAEVAQHLKAIDDDTGDLHYVYIVDRVDGEGKADPAGRLLGVVTLLELLTHDPSTRLAEFAHYNIVSASPEEDQEAVAELITKYNLLALPVIDQGGHLLGTITVDDVVEFMGKGTGRPVGVPASAKSELEGTGAGASAGKDGDGAKHQTLDGGTIGQEIGGFFRKAWNGFTWVLPQYLTWVALWMAASLMVFAGRPVVMNIMERIMVNVDPALETGAEIPHWLLMLDLSLIFVQVTLFALPFILLAVHHSVLRGISVYTDKVVLAPKALIRYLLALVIGAAQACLGFTLAIALYVLNTSFLGMSIEMDSLATFWHEFTDFAGILAVPVFVPLLLACLIASLFAAWRIGIVVDAEEAGKTIHPRRNAAATMLVFMLSFIMITYPFAWIWNASQQRNAAIEQEMMGGDEWADWGDEEMMFDDQMLQELDLEALGLEGLDGLDLEGISFDDEPVYHEDLMGTDDQGEVVLD